MKLFSGVAIAFTAIVASNFIASCGQQAKMERCKFVEIEVGEFEVEFGDIDAEGGEVEMVCGDKIVGINFNESYESEITPP